MSKLSSDDFGYNEECYECGGDGFVESDDWQDWGEEYECDVCNGCGFIKKVTE
jgi:DnaJ-class molecular chaperone